MNYVFFFVSLMYLSNTVCSSLVEEIKNIIIIIVIVLYFVVRYFVSILVLQSSRWVALLCLSFWCLVIVVGLYLTMPRVCLQFVIVVFPDHTHLLISV